MTDRPRKPGGGGRRPSERTGPRRGPPRGARSIESILDAQPWDSLRSLLAEAGVDVERALDRLRRFAALLLDWNRSVSNLISRNDEVRIVTRHLRESLEPARRLKETGAARWMDFGSGAGLPAIPLAIAGVGERWTLVESRRPKALFMRKSLQELELKGIDVIHSRLEEVVRAGQHRAAFNGFTSRATIALGPTLLLAADLVRPGGRAFLWKGSRRDEEMESDRGWEKNWDSEGFLRIGAGENSISIMLRKKWLL